MSAFKVAIVHGLKHVRMIQDKNHVDTFYKRLMQCECSYCGYSNDAYKHTQQTGIENILAGDWLLWRFITHHRISNEVTV